VRAGARKTVRPSEAEREILRLAEVRVAIESVTPEIDAGLFPAKCAEGDSFVVEADIFSDGHDHLGAALLVRAPGGRAWQETPLEPLVNDRWRGGFVPDRLGLWSYTIAAWRDPLATWLADIGKKHAARLPVAIELEEGAVLLERTLRESDRGTQRDRARLGNLARRLRTARDIDGALAGVASPEIKQAWRRAGLRLHETRHPRQLALRVDARLAVHSAWYEIFPRSQSNDALRHGTFDDVIGRLPYVCDMGFDVLYLTPIHPIGRTARKGRNNALVARPGDPGSPYAIGSAEGGHEAIHPELGTLEDFARLVEAAAGHGLMIALDLAVQCSRDHPWIAEHPEWFDWRPDGSIRFAENPPKAYEDIVNVHVYRDAFPAIWFELRDLVLLWIGRGIKIFRVDNPHTKPFPFWEWLIGEVLARHPDVVFLSEAFTRPKVMKHLAKRGFNQSYSYFTWRNTKTELVEYLTELTRGACAAYMRPNFFANTPDINPVYLQSSGRPGFQVRLVLAATLGGNYGIYSGFELCEAAAVAGREEYLDSEKYQLKSRDYDDPRHIRADIRLVNRLRREHRALQEFRNLAFYNAWNDNILYYGKRTPDLQSFLLFAVNLDPAAAQETHFEIPLWEFGLPDEAAIAAQDLVTGDRFTWRGKVQHMRIDPLDRPYMIWRLFAPGGAP